MRATAIPSDVPNRRWARSARALSPSRSPLLALASTTVALSGADGGAIVLVAGTLSGATAGRLDVVVLAAGGGVDVVALADGVTDAGDEPATDVVLVVVVVVAGLGGRGMVIAAGAVDGATVVGATTDDC